MKRVELLAPAGNIAKAKIAFAFGADAIYLGIPDFSLRVRINDFGKKEIKEIVKYARGLKKKVYVTINIFAHNQQIDKLPSYIKFLRELKVDALIVADPGVIALLKVEWPQAEIHLSTQANCTNWQSAKFWYDQGVSRVILGREVTLKEIRQIHKRLPKLELEYFVHGAMCMAYSGRCFLSKYYTGRSANQGDCTQPCRWNFYITEEKRPDQPLEIVEEKHGSYILNSKDLCLIKHLKKIKEAGVSSFKIEGRAKSVYYQAVVVNAYRKGIDNLSQGNLNTLAKELETRLVHRGYTTGFLLGEKADQNLTAAKVEPDWEFCAIAEQASRNNQVKIRVHNTLKVGDNLEIVRPNLKLLKIVLKQMYNTNGQEITEAHGGSKGGEVVVRLNQDVPQYSVFRRKLT